MALVSGLALITGMVATCSSVNAAVFDTQMIVMLHEVHELIKKPDKKCKPGYSFKSQKAACKACHFCREFNKCPCSYFSIAEEHKFCYDSHAPDMNKSSPDAHNTAMHCDKLVPHNGTFKACPKNAVQPFRKALKSFAEGPFNWRAVLIVSAMGLFSSL
mmetsp:Transcript_58355/g.115691  ORF Transcript_58355/g.115691 Transcript_58355/m.115691 type:complete len:159 (-) Transcript_58355:49-525(-)